MKRSLASSAATFVSCLLLAVAAQAARWQDDPLPPRTTGQWALVEARVNGVPMQAQELKSELSVDQLVSYYEGRWKRLGSPVVRPQGGKRLLSLDLPDLHLALQVQADGSGTTAVLSQAKWRERQLDFMPQEMPQPLRAQVTQVTETRDGPRRSRLVAVQSQDGFELTRQRLLSHARSQGWRPVVDQLQQKDGGKQWIAAFERNGLSVDAALLQSGNAPLTHLTINFLDSPP